MSIIDLQNKKDHIISIRDKIKNHRVSLVEQSQSSLLKAIENLKNGNTDIVIPQLQSIANDDLKPIKELEKTTAQLSVYVKALNELIREKN